jgi:glycosyltransferase involved in cell wall biosynthesis
VWGGNEKWLVTTANGLRTRGHDVVIAAPPGALASRARDAGVPVSHERQRGYEPFALMRFARWLRESGTDAVIISSWSDMPAGAMAARLAGVPRILVRLGIARSVRPRTLQALALRRLVTGIIVNAEVVRDTLRASAPWLDPSRVHLVRNAVVRRPITEERRASLRRDMGDGGDAMLLASAGNAYPRKGFDRLLRAFARAAPEDARLAIIGGGPQLEELTQLSRALGVHDRVALLGHRTDAPELIAASDAFALASRNEGMANVILEAMAAGRPIVATDVSGVSEALGPREGRPPAGWIVPPDDDAALADALARVLDPSDGARADALALASEATWRAEHWFALERMLDDVERVLREH